MGDGLAATAALSAALGLASAIHCLGMCGGFSLLVAGRESGWRRAAGALARFHAGRLSSYAFLGSLAGLLGERLLALGAPRRALALVAGTALAALALERLGLLARCAARLQRLAAPVAGIAALLRRLAARRDGVSLLLFGAANGFLPCAATAGGVALAAAAGSAPAGAASMLSFGLATVPGLVAGALLAARVAPSRARLFSRCAAALTLLVGLVTLWRAGVAPDTPCCAAAP